MTTINPPTTAERNQALDYLSVLVFPNGKTLESYYNGDPTKNVPASLDTIAGLVTMYHRDKSPLPVLTIKTGRKFKEG